MATHTIPTDFPDDPRDCCKAIRAIFNDESAFGAGRADIPTAALEFAELVALASEHGDSAEWAMRSLNLLVSMARDVLREQSEAHQRISWLARHGVGDCREMDARAAARMRAFEAGEPLPCEATFGEVMAVKRVLGAIGASIPENDEIVKMLEAAA
jgi:hypothetical protein